MRATRTLALAAALLVARADARAADPVVVELPARATARTSVVTVGGVAALSGGDAAARQRVAALDVAEFKPRAETVTVTRRQVEYRLLLAGFDRTEVVVVGEERAVVTVGRRAVTADEVVAAARRELLLHHPAPGTVTVALRTPIVVKLPEVAADDPVTITVQPHARVPVAGPVQMNAAISVGGERVLSLAVWLEVTPAARADGSVEPAGGVVPARGPGPEAPGGGGVLVRPRQRVTMQVRSGALTVTAVGEAQQEGRLGQTVLVQNVDSKKTVTARVTGPGVVDIELGGGP
ncbi:: SAF_2 [Gemmataceae bacterium]|nr:: SAF_2 [Gemmataceae bacterium]VTT97929.1 : SAF_2 [Gemmataceae bacterium]